MVASNPARSDALRGVEGRLKLGVSNAPFIGWPKFIENVADEITSGVEPINVQRLGILPDGTDYSTEFEALLPNDGSTVTLYFPASESDYVLSNVSLVNQTDTLVLIGDGMLSTSIYIGGGSNASFYRPSGGGSLRIKGMKVYGNAATSAESTSAYDDRTIMEFPGVTSVAAHIIAKCKFEDVWFDDLKGVIFGARYTNSDYAFKDFQVVGCVVTNMRRCGFMLSQTADLLAERWVFRDTVIDGVGWNTRNTPVTCGISDSSKYIQLSYSSRKLPYKNNAEVTGSVSGATGFVTSVVDGNGSGVGTIILRGIAGTFQSGETLNTTDPRNGSGMVLSSGPTVLPGPSVGEVFTPMDGGHKTVGFTIDAINSNTSIDIKSLTKLSEMVRSNLDYKPGYFDQYPKSSNISSVKRWCEPPWNAYGRTATLVGDQGGYVFISNTRPIDGNGTQPFDGIFGIWIASDNDHRSGNQGGGATQKVTIDGCFIGNIGGFEIKAGTAGISGVNFQGDEIVITNTHFYNLDSSNGDDTEMVYTKAGQAIVSNCIFVNAGPGGLGSGSLRITGGAYDAIEGDDGLGSACVVDHNQLINMRGGRGYARIQTQTSSPQYVINNYLEGPKASLKAGSAASSRKGGPVVVRGNSFVDGGTLEVVPDPNVIEIDGLIVNAACIVSDNIITHYSQNSSGGAIISYAAGSTDFENLNLGLRMLLIENNIMTMDYWMNADGQWPLEEHDAIKIDLFFGRHKLIRVAGNVLPPCKTGLIGPLNGIVEKLIIENNYFDPATDTPYAGPGDRVESATIRNNVGLWEFDTADLDHGAAVATGALGTARTITITGTKAGDCVTASATGSGLETAANYDVLPRAVVSADDTLTCNVLNLSGGNYDASAVRHRGEVSRLDGNPVGVRWSGSLINPNADGAFPFDVNQQEVIDGGHYLRINLAGATWATAGANFDAQRKNIIMGIITRRSNGRFLSQGSSAVPFQPGENVTFAGGNADIYGVWYYSALAGYANFVVNAGTLSDSTVITGATSGATATYRNDRFDEPAGLGVQLDSIAVGQCTRISDTEAQILMPALPSLSYSEVNVGNDLSQEWNGDYFTYALPPAAIVTTPGRLVPVRPPALVYWAALIKNFTGT